MRALSPTTGDHRRWTLFAMCFALFMIMLDNTIVNVALPSIQRELATSPSTLEWTVNAYVLTFAALILLGGKLGDRLGRKRMFIVGLGIFTLASAACAVSSTSGQLIAARVLQGAGAALLNPLSLSILVATFPRRELPAAIGVWAGVSGLGLAFGPLAGGFLVEHVSWSAVFWVNVPVGILAAAVCAAAVRESRDPSTGRFDVLGTAFVTAALFLLTFGLIKTNTHDLGSAYVLRLLGAALVLFGLFVAWERRAPDPMIPLSFFRRRAFAVSTVVVLFVGLALFGAIYYVSLFFQNVQGHSALGAGARTLPMTLMILVVSPVAGRLNGRVGPRAPLVAGMLLASAGAFGLAHLEADTGYGSIWPFFALLGAGLALTMPAVSATAMGAVEATKAGIASGVVNASRQVGGALGIAVLGAIATSRIDHAWTAEVASLPAGAREGAARLSELVAGGQVALVGRAAGPGAQAAAADAFMHGMNSAFLVASGLTLVAGLVAWAGLGGVRAAHPAPERGTVPVEA